MSKTIVSKIDGKFVHDASSLHGLTPNVSTYTMTIGDPSSAHTSTASIGLPSDVMVRSEDSSAFASAGHVHNVKYEGETNAGGQVIPTGTVSKPAITANNTKTTIGYVSDCSVKTESVASGDLLKSWVYDPTNESLSFVQGRFNVSSVVDSFTVVTDTAPEMSSEPTFTGNALPTHTHTFDISTLTGKDISHTLKPNQLLYTTSDGKPVNVAAKMAAVKSVALADVADGSVNNVVSNEQVDTNTYMLTCQYPVTLIGAEYDGTTQKALGPVFGSVGSSAETTSTTLTSLQLSDSVGMLGKNAVNNCTSLTSIGYLGTAEEWNRIVRDAEFDKGCNMNIHVICSDGKNTVMNVPDDNKLIYTTSNNQIASLYNTSGFNVAIASHTYTNGRGVITFNGTLTSIGDGAFGYCSTITNIALPATVTSLGWAAFAMCTTLRSINMPLGMASIGESAFGGTMINEIYLPDTLSIINNQVFYGTALTSLKIPQSVTFIGNSAFESCINLRTVNIPNNITTLHDCIFCYCQSLTDIVIPDDVTTICYCAFWQCYGLTNVVIPALVTSIGRHAFGQCIGLTSITSLNPTPPNIDSETFLDVPTCPIYVPAASVDAYKTAANWSARAASIQALPTT